MSAITEIIDELENKIEKLVAKINSSNKKVQNLEIELAKSAAIIQIQTQEIEALNKKYDTIKVSCALLGSEENKRDAKHKINSIIREIDYCIAQLAD
jgi:chromosome segregation ATPase